MDTITKQLVKGWGLLSIGALMISIAGGIAWSIVAALAIAGIWTIVFGISVLSDAGLGKNIRP